MKLQKLDKAAKAIKDNPYVLLILALGILLIMLPGGEKQTQTQPKAESSSIAEPSFSVAREQDRLQKVLESISGVGKTEVLLSVKSTARRELAYSRDEAVIVSAGSGKEQVVEEGYSYPEYQGAVIVCQGAGSAAVRLQVYEAAAAFTGLDMSSIKVLKMK